MSDILDDDALRPVDPRYRNVLRVRMAVLGAMIVAAGIFGEFMVDGWHGAFVGPALVIAATILWLLPKRRYRRISYALGRDCLRVRQGWLRRTDTVVPLGRVQHIDVHQPMIDRAFGLAILILHTAGSHNASVGLPGLSHEDAVAMREEIAARIRRELA